MLCNLPFEKLGNRNPPKEKRAVVWQNRRKPLKNRLAAGISGCCDRREVATATHPAFSCFLISPDFLVLKLQ
jgi:hypothetical protein